VSVPQSVYFFCIRSVGIVSIGVDDAESLFMAVYQFTILKCLSQKDGIRPSICGLSQLPAGYPLLVAIVSPQAIIGVLFEMEMVVTLTLMKEVGTLLGITDHKVALPHIRCSGREAE
jgi:hypothetical protein